MLDDHHTNALSHDELRETPGGEIACRVMGVNRGGLEGEFVRCMLTAHRSGQQDFARLALRFLLELAKDALGHDERNEAAVEAAKKVRDALGEYGWALPRI